MILQLFCHLNSNIQNSTAVIVGRQWWPIAHEEQRELVDNS